MGIAGEDLKCYKQQTSRDAKLESAVPADDLVNLRYRKTGQMSVAGRVSMSGASFAREAPVESTTVDRLPQHIKESMLQLIAQGKHITPLDEQQSAAHCLQVEGSEARSEVSPCHRVFF